MMLFVFALKVLNEDLDIVAINHTHIALIPKISNPGLITHFQPISFYVFYKIVSKVLANYLKLVKNSLIDNTQGAFLLGCLITDNATIDFEIFHSLQSNKS